MSHPTTPEEVAAEALRLENADDLEGAQRQLELGVASHENSGGLWHNLGLIRSRNGDPEGAIEAYSRAIELGYPSHVNRGVNYELLQLGAEAVSDYLAALAKEPDNLDALIDLGTLYVSQGEVESAERLLSRAAALDEKANWQLADAYSLKGDPASARESLLRAIAAGESRAYLDLAELTANSHDSSLAEDYFLEAIRAGAVLARRQYAEYLDEIGKVDRGIEVALEGIRLGDGSCFQPLAVMLEETGDLPGALANYRLAVADGDSELQEEVIRLESSMTRDD